MTLDQICDTLSCMTEIDEKSVLKLLKAQAELIASSLDKDGEFKLYHIGTLRKKANGRTAGQYRVSLKVSEHLKRAVNTNVAS